MKIKYQKRSGKRERREFNDGNFDKLFKAAFAKWHLEKFGVPYIS